MSDHRELLERARDRFPVPDLPLDAVIRQRDRRRVRQRILASVVGVGVFLVGALAFSAAMQRDPVGPPGGRTPSVSPTGTPPSDDTWNDLYEVDPSTGEATLLLADQRDQTEPERSPDGTRIVYQSQTSGGLSDQIFQIFMLDADGTTHQLTDLTGGASEPTWSPDGKEIAFVADFGIFVMDADGGNLRQLTAGDDGDRTPDWSPDGSRIAFSRGPEESSAIWLVSMDGAETRVTRSEWGDSYPAWSPNGRWIAFVRYEARHGGNLEMNDSDLWLIRPDGSDERRVVPGEAKEYEMAWDSPDDHFQGELSWSPEGRSIAFSGGHCGCVTLVDAASGEIQTLTVTTSQWSGGIDAMSWGADGTILGSRAEPDSEVYD